MFRSKIDLANMALSHVGIKKNISSFTERTAEANIVNQWYDVALEHILSDGDWSHARKRRALPLDAEAAPEGEWSFRYTLPSDCVAPRRLEYPTGSMSNPFSAYHIFQPDAVPYNIEISGDGERKTLLTNLEDAVLVYTFLNDNTAHYTAAFQIAFSYCLAYYIAYPLTTRANLVEMMFQQYTYSKNKAISLDGQGEIPKAPRDAESIRARY